MRIFFQDKAYRAEKSKLLRPPGRSNKRLRVDKIEKWSKIIVVSCKSTVLCSSSKEEKQTGI